MKVSIGTNIKEGPWGGGNLFAINLSTFLKNKGHEVVYDLKHNDIDIIFKLDKYTIENNSRNYDKELIGILIATNK